MSCFTCSKYVLIFFNFIFWLSGALVLGVGIWLMVDPSILDKVSFINLTDQDQYYLQTAAVLMIAVGAIVTIVGFFGCCGAIKESKCCLGIYIAFLVIIMIVEIAIGICGILLLFVYQIEAEEELKGGMLKSLQNDYGRNDLATETWDSTQQEFTCCGVFGPEDYQSNFWANTTGKNTSTSVPYSCCVHGGTFDSVNKRFTATNYTLCQKEAAELFGNPNKTVAYVYKNNCYEQVKTFLSQYSIIIAAVGLGIALLEIFGLICACCVCCKLGKNTYSYYR